MTNRKDKIKERLQSKLVSGKAKGLVRSAAAEASLKREIFAIEVKEVKQAQLDKEAVVNHAAWSYNVDGSLSESEVLEKCAMQAKEMEKTPSIDEAMLVFSGTVLQSKWPCAVAVKVAEKMFGSACEDPNNDDRVIVSVGALCVLRDIYEHIPCIITRWYICLNRMQKYQHSPWHLFISQGLFDNEKLCDHFCELLLQGRNEAAVSFCTNLVKYVAVGLPYKLLGFQQLVDRLAELSLPPQSNKVVQQVVEIAKQVILQETDALAALEISGYRTQPSSPEIAESAALEGLHGLEELPTGDEIVAGEDEIVAGEELPGILTQPSPLVIE